MSQQLKGLSKEGSISGLVLDLRGNSGGLLHEAIGVSAAYLPSNATVTSTIGRTEDANRVYHATTADYRRAGVDGLRSLPPEVKMVPMVVLIDGGSAAASEIVAGALQDSGRAKIIGKPSFGKASIQTILPLSKDTALKLTTSRWLTPSGRSVLGTGITPDILLDDDQETPQGASYDNQVKHAVAALRAL